VSPFSRVVLGFLLLDAVLLALIEMLFLPAYLGAVQFPITAAVAAVTTPLLVAEASRLSSGRGVALAPFAVWFITLFVFGALGPGGDMVLVGSDWRTILLIGAGTVPSAIMLAIVTAQGRPRR
jgi:hypothetical protein